MARDCVEEGLRSSAVRGDAVENARPARGEALGRVPQRRRVLWPGVVAQTCSQNLWPRAASAAGTAGCSTLHLNSLNWCTRIEARALAVHVDLNYCCFMICCRVSSEMKYRV